ncbi:MAG: glycoside hydrolase family 15 protein [Bacteriovoracaceae bacterium]|nr:glycoside hydrolase family 15 protein [Bacteriovoracaceae bacterium]
MKKFIFITTLLMTLSSGTYAFENCNGYIDTDFSIDDLLLNASYPGTKPGVVVASPSRRDPDYFFHWVRDAALVMDSMLQLNLKTLDANVKIRTKKILQDYVVFSRENQITPTLTGLGEPKFNVDGTAFNGPWGRPQNDGPALRANILISLYFHAKDFELSEKLLGEMILTDLDYVVKEWKNPSFDYWEEVKGLHFVNFMAYARALDRGQEVIRRLGVSARPYRDAYLEIQDSLRKFWDPNKQIVVATLDRVEGVDYKHSGIDVATIIGSLYNESHARQFGPTSPQMQNTVLKMIDGFENMYPINHNSNLATAIGRYPEDKYDGHGFGEGHPWFLATHYTAEYFYRLGIDYNNAGKIEITEQNLEFFKRFTSFNEPQIIESDDDRFAMLLAEFAAHGDAFMARTQEHIGRNGHISEQYSRYNGYMRGAERLTWSYASQLTAVWAQERLSNIIRK